MNGARFVHDRLELAGWQVEIADAQKVKASAACQPRAAGPVARDDRSKPAPHRRTRP
jgi:hypothetical protein